jgi:hypothetical protein
VMHTILGAASFAVRARRIVLCESLRDGSDEQLYKLWFNDEQTAVVPMGTSTNVLSAADTMKERRLIAGSDTIAIIDRDERSDEHLQELASKGVHVLQVSELEGLFCLTQVMEAAAKILSPTIGEADLKQRAREKVQKFFKGPALNRLVADRVRRAVRHKLASLLDGARGAVDFASTRAALEGACDPTIWHFKVGDMADDENRARQDALANADWDTAVLRLFPAKNVLDLVAQTIGVGREKYKECVLEILRSDPRLTPQSPHASVHSQVVAALRSYLPPRAVLSAIT